MSSDVNEALETTMPNGHGDAFAFVQALAEDLSSNKIELPSFPDVVLRIRKALADENCTMDQIVRVVGSDPTLAARLIRMSNSAAMRPAGKAITDLRFAISRMGHNMVRSVAMSFAMGRMRGKRKLKALEHLLEEEWKHSTFVAAVCYVLAKKRTKLNPDEALLVGLMHGVGRLYILNKAEDHPFLFEEAETLDSIMRDWHSGIGRAILETWEFPEAMVNAINEQGELDRHLEEEQEDQVDLTDVLQGAIVLADAFGADAGGQASIEDIGAFKRMSLTREDCVAVIEESDEEIRELSKVLGK